MALLFTAIGHTHLSINVFLIHLPLEMFGKNLVFRYFLRPNFKINLVIVGQKLAFM